MKHVLPLAFIFLFIACSEKELPEESIAVEQEPESAPVPPELAEASGMADSKAHPGHLWVHEDSGNGSELYLLTHAGELSRTVYLKGVANRDWEDIALSGDELYLADIGDNLNAHPTCTIYKFTEPDAATNVVTDIQQITYKYPDGAHDAEALLVDPATKDIYIITKRDQPSEIYRLTYPYSLTKTNTAELVGTLPYNGVVSAAISADGKGIIVKTYANIFYYNRSGKEPISKVLQKKLTTLPYKIEPQGEAVTFSAEKKGYFTLSEKAFKDEANLYLYKLNK
ncbi:hypothetical protein WG947_07630 [Pontibacter sp. H259]|uniref:hypothetical protein n=1 Tax=Pontibacter sp. H259 TaxID=3133421 RepID=UPI0030BF2175